MYQLGFLQGMLAQEMWLCLNKMFTKCRCFYPLCLPNLNEFSFTNLFFFLRFNIASRSASGPPCGTRIIAGRIVKESYGAAKQQHTFTVRA